MNKLLIACSYGDSIEYKDLEARVDALRAAHISLLKYVLPHPLPPPSQFFLKK